MRSLAPIRMPILILIFAIGLAWQMPGQAAPTAPACDAIVMAAADDPYLPLAEEIAARDGLPLVHTLPEALQQSPIVLLWVASPAHLSDQAIVEAGRALRRQPLAAGIISGATVEEARALWQRGSEVRGRRVVAVNAEYPAAGVTVGRIVRPGEGTQPLSVAALREALPASDYLTFTGHGGNGYWRLDDDTRFSAAEVPALGPVVVSASSCNTFRPWEPGSIALAFAGRGAAAYTGFSYSPNEGYLIGAYEGLPFRYTWPGFPIGCVVAAQNRGTLQGFAALPYYWLLGDPRIALQAAPPYTSARDEAQGSTRTLAYTGLPAGVVPIRVPGGAGYGYVEAAGITAASAHDPLYNSRLQMVDIGADKYLLVEHAGGDLTLTLRRRPPLGWMALDLLSDSLDHSLVYVQSGGGDLIGLVAGALACLAVAWRARRKKTEGAAFLAAALAGLACAGLHALYALARLGQVTITSKPLAPLPLAWAGSGLLVAAGALLYLTARSRRGRELALWLAASMTLMAGLIGSAPCVANVLLFAPRVGAGLYNGALALLALGTLIVELALFEAAFALLRRALRARTAPPQPAAADTR